MSGEPTRDATAAQNHVVSAEEVPASAKRPRTIKRRKRHITVHNLHDNGTPIQNFAEPPGPTVQRSDLAPMRAQIREHGYGGHERTARDTC
ncbi:hypothetical protein ACFV2N_48430 [Streptomyces sp. NPDC059680]|uniref:hypothetical protein n=1 Tax=Streptomyces sp. NPDC059680 TaxID=3346904 RepID=UPI0036A34C0F